LEVYLENLELEIHVYLQFLMNECVSVRMLFSAGHSLPSLPHRFNSGCVRVLLNIPVQLFAQVTGYITICIQTFTHTDLGSTMVCMGNHNKGSVAEFFLGSVSQVRVQMVGMVLFEVALNFGVSKLYGQ